MRKAVILCAGLGSRLQPLTKDQPKCLTEVHGKSILANMLEALEAFGIQETILVVGYLREKIQETIGQTLGGMKIRYAVNVDFATTNTSYSLLLGLRARNFEDTDQILILEGDVFFESSLLSQILNDDAQNSTLVEKYSPELDGSFVALDGDFVSDWIHKSRRKSDFTIEDKFKTVNIHKFSGKFVTDTLIPTIESFLVSGLLKAPLEFVMEDIVTRGITIKAIEATPHRWFEIDNVEELAYAQNLFSP